MPLLGKRLFILIVVLSFVTCAMWACGDDEKTDDDDAADDDTQNTDDDDDNDDNDNDDDDDDTPVTLQIDLATLEDKIQGSWVGQMAGVTWGAPTEFHYRGEIMPDGEVPEWEPTRINRGFNQDDIYVEIPFLDVMSTYDVTAGWVAFGEAFRDTQFILMHANLAARRNLRDGIPAPDSGHYTNNEHCDDIDWQIESDFVGAICPGLVNPAVDIAWRAGHVMNFGDGVLGGVFIAAMHSAAFFAEDLVDIISAGRRVLPEGSKYRMVVDDVIAWYTEGRSWEVTWQLLQDKWGADDRCPGFENRLDENYNIDAIVNGAYVLIGLLYGDGDFEQSMRIAMRCGQDSDCNPSSVGGILGNWMGLSQIPDKFKRELESDRRFMFTDYTFEDVISTTLDLSRQVMLQAGAVVEGVGEDEVWTIPFTEEIQPPLLEQWPEIQNVPPVLSASVISQDGPVVELEADATDADGVLAYEWHFGDLSRAKGAQVEHEYASAGTYEVIAYVTDWAGNTSWQAISVTIP
ncbi:MAG: ADP-ribosylglycohydrolase family protein [Candidatus Lernaella stagnicola]|nr:ADP-ribosylglycohydrolase family protein [Candidatus Lernaella stagnicola]